MTFLLKKKIHEDEQRFSTDKIHWALPIVLNEKKVKKNLIHWLTIFSKFLPT